MLTSSPSLGKKLKEETRNNDSNTIDERRKDENNNNELMLDIELGDESLSSSRTKQRRGRGGGRQEEVDNDDEEERFDNKIIKKKNHENYTTMKQKSLSLLFTCGMYSFCSVSVILSQKSLASDYNQYLWKESDDDADEILLFSTKNNLNLILIILQAIITIVCIILCKRLRWIDYPSFSIPIAKHWLSVNFWFCCMLYSGVCALQYNSIPMVIIYKNLTNILVTIGDYYYYCYSNNNNNNERRQRRQQQQPKLSWTVLLAFGIMILGAFMAFYNKYIIINNNNNNNESNRGLIIGFVWMIINSITTAAYILTIKIKNNSSSATMKKLSKFGMIYYNNIMSLLWFLPLSIWTGQWTLLYQSSSLIASSSSSPSSSSWFHSLFSTKFYWIYTNLYNGCIGFVLNFASLRCVAMTGPIMYAMIGSFNKIPMIVLGYYLFSSNDDKNWNICFWIIISLLGGFLYSYAKIMISRTTQKIIR